MTAEQLQALAKDPIKVLQEFTYIDAHIGLKLEEIRRYYDMTQHITRELSPVATFGSYSQSTIEICVANIVDLQQLLNAEIEELKNVRLLAIEVLNMVDEPKERLVLEYRYLSGYDWHMIAKKLDCTKRWVQELHSKAIHKLTKAANEKQEELANN